MRVTYRSHGVKEYWAKRWAGIPADQPMQNRDAYPLKYAEMVVVDTNRRILEAGCGAGRILRYYHERGFDIVGIDYIEGAVEKLRQIDASLQVEVGDITQLRFPDRNFGVVLAFGLYHNLEHGLEQAISETRRVLTKDGLVCASFRADNLQTKLTDWLAARRAGANSTQSGARSFHKLNLTRGEYERLFSQVGFEVRAVYPVENMPILYKFAFFRASDHKVFDENRARKEGYRLSWLGQRLQNLLMRVAPDQFCNIYVLIARRVD